MGFAIKKAIDGKDQRCALYTFLWTAAVMTFLQTDSPLTRELNEETSQDPIMETPVPVEI